MDITTEVREFLTTRRARLSPTEAGLPAYGANRRVPGLKREEVALLAGVSTEYYARLERGNLRGVSESVLEALARALQLDEAERLHLFDLARAAAASPRTTTARRPRPRVRPSVERVLAGMSGTPAYLRNAHMDIVAANPLGYALYTGILTPEALPVNLARFLFLDPRAQEFFVDWDTVADGLAAALRTEAGRTPRDRVLSGLIGELATGSTEFATRWARHNVLLHRTARKRLRNPVVGDIELTGDAFELPGEGLTLITYTAEAGSRAQEQLDFLASWATTHPTAVPATSPGAPALGPVVEQFAPED